ncbi:CLUMA_CG014849, isoform A [Clunio marinus]|uniref:CLUMA_CG014849, isoform A n=1 Tax=Clunio marinus TaxID=568069 RepID=A0A1J1IMB1_9DIPT|nr:CLUMA_CG014849, isoform A [Clunio marinus]
MTDSFLLVKGIEKFHQCNLCPSMLSSAIGLKIHMQHKHSGLKTTQLPCQPDDPSKKTTGTSTENVAGAAESDLVKPSPSENSSDTDSELNNTVVAAQVEPVFVPAEPVVVPDEPVPGIVRPPSVHQQPVPVRPRPLIAYELDNNADPEYEYSFTATTPHSVKEFSNVRVQTRPIQRCPRCGILIHFGFDCPAINAICRLCNQKGHYQYHKNLTDFYT